MLNEEMKKVDFIEVYIVLKKELETNGTWRLHFKENENKKFYEFDTQKEAIEYFKDNFSNAAARVHGKNGKWKYRITIKDNQISLKTYNSKGDSPDEINEKENITSFLEKNSTEIKVKPKKKKFKIGLLEILMILSIAANLIVTILLILGVM